MKNDHVICQGRLGTQRNTGPKTAFLSAGLTLNRAELERMSKPRGWKPGPFPRFIIRTRFTNGAAMWFPFPMRAGNHVMPQEHGGPPMRYDALCQTDYWDDDGTAEWVEMMARCEKDGEVLEFTPRL